jgi:hypothetical protein
LQTLINELNIIEESNEKLNKQLEEERIQHATLKYVLAQRKSF